jgi:hypothetical protein
MSKDAWATYPRWVIQNLWAWTSPEMKFFLTRTCTKSKTAIPVIHTIASLDGCLLLTIISPRDSPGLPRQSRSREQLA